jgi:hypothetical protein
MTDIIVSRGREIGQITIRASDEKKYKGIVPR